jgi:hypothetical protein
MIVLLFFIYFILHALVITFRSGPWPGRLSSINRSLVLFITTPLINHLLVSSRLGVVFGSAN